jgi:hypothetical protein
MKDAYDQAIAKAREPEKRLIETLCWDTRIFGVPAKQFTSWNSHNSNSWEFIDALGIKNPRDTWQKFLRTVPKECVWSADIDF